jgi:hypothetical protein
MKTNGANAIGVGSGACHCGPQCYQLVYCSLTCKVGDICASHAMTWQSPHGTPMLDSGAHNHWCTLCHNQYVAAMQCWRPCLLFWFGMIHDSGWTKPCLAEGTGLVGIHCPEVTRPVDMLQPSCYYGGRYDNIGFRSSIRFQSLFHSRCPNISTKRAALLHHPGLCLVLRIINCLSSAQFAVQICIVMRKMAMSRALPVDEGSKKATFTALAANFGFDDKVRDLFLTGHMENLEDFRYYFADEEEIEAFVAIAGGWSAPERRRQTSMVKQAWTAVRQSGSSTKSYNTASSTTEIDSDLEKSTLKEARLRFWERYKLKYPVEVFPSDYLLSRCHTEVGMRLLTVYDVQEVGVSPHQVSTIKRGERVSTDPSTSRMHTQRVKQGEQGVEGYLAALHTYLLALAVVGSAKTQGAPTEETFVTDPTEFVEVPWDVLQAYYFRASRSAMLVPQASRLAWLEEKDTVERSSWASRFRIGHRSLGQVIQSVMDESGNHWHTPIQGNVALTIPAPLPQPPTETTAASKRSIIKMQKWLAKRTVAARALAQIKVNTWGNGKILRTIQGGDISANKKVQRNDRNWVNRIAAQIASSSHYGRILPPGLNKDISVVGGTTKAPISNPATHMMRRNLSTSARTEVVMTPASSVMGLDADDEQTQGAYVKQALQQQQRGENLGSREAWVEDMQWTSEGDQGN